MAKMTLDDLVAQLRAAYGSNLRSIVLYGSAAGGERTAKRSDHNVLVIVDHLGFDALRKVAAVARAWGETGNPPPLTFTDVEWRSSADIFPMEYADILERNVVLHGDPPFDGIRVDPDHLRLQLEFESMGKLLKLRQGVLASGGDGKRLLELLEVSLGTVLVIFRAFLRLHGRPVPTDNAALAGEVAAVAGFDVGPFHRAIRHVRGDGRLTGAEAEPVTMAYVDAVERLVRYLDRYRHPEHRNNGGGSP
jgi:hypothetical protein